MDFRGDKLSGHYRAYLLSRLAEVVLAEERMRETEKALRDQGLDSEVDQINRQSLQRLRELLEEELSKLD